MQARTNSALRIGQPCLLLMLCLPLPLLAQTQPAAPTAAEATLNKPTDFRSRVEIRNEYQDLKDGGYRNLIIPRFEYAVTPAVAFRIDTPYIDYDPGTSGAGRSSAFGDLLIRGAWRATQREGFALVLVTEVIFDTANDPRFGQGKTIVAPLVYAAIDLPKIDSVFFPNIQHYFSVAGDENRPDVNFTTLKPNLLTRWPDGVYTFLEPQFAIDWERDAKVGLTVELEVGKLLSKNVAAWARPGIGVINGDELPQLYNWNLEVGMRYIF
ncbi:MAG TPA: hypothetical protein VGQ19_17375 [Burkholderiales bacterium]|jgi:hypothetical protein|nr:hypothetical protein [Burkholderiales bacterium]